MERSNMPLDPRSARPADLKILESVVPGLVGCIATHPQFQVPWVLETVQRQDVSCSSDLLLFETREISFEDSTRCSWSSSLVSCSSSSQFSACFYAINLTPSKKSLRVGQRTVGDYPVFRRLGGLPCRNLLDSHLFEPSLPMGRRS